MRTIRPDANQGQVIQPVDQAEQKAALQVPTLYSNRYIVSATPDGVKIVFGEQWEDQPAAFRTAVYMDTSNAVELAKLITALTTQIYLSVEGAVQQNTASSGAIIQNQQKDA